MSFLKNKYNISFRIYTAGIMILYSFSFLLSGIDDVLLLMIDNNDLLCMLFFPAYFAFQAGEVSSAKNLINKKNVNFLRNQGDTFQYYIDFFKKFPAAIEIYDKEGILVWKNPVAIKR